MYGREDVLARRVVRRGGGGMRRLLKKGRWLATGVAGRAELDLR